MPKKFRVQLHPEMPSHLPQAHTILGAVLATALAELRVDAALHVGHEWYPIYNSPEEQSNTFELDFGLADERYRYNERCFAKVFRHGRVVLGAHAGFFDLFVPVGDSKRTWGALAVGSFSRSRPASGDILARFHDLSGRHGRLSDPAFQAYVSVTLSKLTLDAKLLDAFTRLVSCFATLLSGQGDATAVAKEGAKLRIDLAQARVVERTWEAAHGMVDERSAHSWSRSERNNDLAFLKMDDVPEHAIVGLLWSQGPDPEPLDDLVRRDAFQRECVMLARKIGNVVVGRVGAHGISLLVGASGGKRAPSRPLKSVAERASALARRFGFRLHVGFSDVARSGSLPANYLAALSAAERALSEGARALEATRGTRSRTHAIAELRRQLGRTAAEAPDTLAALFDRYFETIAVHTGYRPDLMRAHLEAGIERILDGIADGGALDPRSHAAIFQALDQMASNAVTVRDLAIAYRGVMSDIELALKRPTEARQSWAAGRALEYIREHLGETLSLERVARIAGVSPNYFSKLFKRQEGRTFEDYTRVLRLERAQHLLRGTDLSVARIAELSGFGTSNYFHRVFHNATGRTPLGFRQQEAAKLRRHEK